MIYIEDATHQDIKTIQDLANRIWWPTYSPILKTEQIQFMLDKIYSENAIEEAMSTQKFLILREGQRAQGFASYGVKLKEPLIYKLHKLYVLPENHGKGYGRMLIEQVQKRSIMSGASALDLNVNRENNAVSFYKKVGFTIIEEEDVPIGPYWMNDYVMRLILPQ